MNRPNPSHCIGVLNHSPFFIPFQTKFTSVACNMKHYQLIHNPRTNHTHDMFLTKLSLISCIFYIHSYIIKAPPSPITHNPNRSSHPQFDISHELFLSSCLLYHKYIRRITNKFTWYRSCLFDKRKLSKIQQSTITYLAPSLTTSEHSSMHFIAFQPLSYQYKKNLIGTTIKVALNLPNA